MDHRLFLALVIFFRIVMPLIAVQLLIGFIILVCRFLKRKAKFPFICLLLLVLSVAAIITHEYIFDHNIEYTPRGEINQVVPSPDGNHEIRTYNYISFNLPPYYQTARAEVVALDTGKSRSLYINFHDRDPLVEWVDEQTVIIGRELLNIYTDAYDYKKESEQYYQFPPQRGE